MSYPPFPAYLVRESRRALAIVAEAVEEAVRALPEGQRLRPDVRLFLIVNLHQMVAQPLTYPEPPVKLDSEVEVGRPFWIISIGSILALATSVYMGGRGISRLRRGRTDSFSSYNV